MVLVCLALSGVCALTCTSTILRARQRNREVGRGAWLATQGSMLFLGVGVGGFLSIWIRTLS